MTGLKMIYVLIALILGGINSLPVEAMNNSSIFNHDFHVKGKKISCERCHGSVKYKKSKELIQKSLCHSCHVKKGPEFIPLSCKKCHDNVTAKSTQKAPTFHNMHGFKTGGHALVASRTQQSCMQCHKKNDCSDCHNRARSLTFSPHKAFFIKSHSLEARMGVTNCSSCHSKNTCTECHRRSK